MKYPIISSNYNPLISTICSFCVTISPLAVSSNQEAWPQDLPIHRAAAIPDAVHHVTRQVVFWELISYTEAVEENPRQAEAPRRTEAPRQTRG